MLLIMFVTSYTPSNPYHHHHTRQPNTPANPTHPRMSSITFIIIEPTTQTHCILVTVWNSEKRKSKIIRNHDETFSIEHPIYGFPDEPSTPTTVNEWNAYLSTHAPFLSTEVENRTCSTSYLSYSYLSQ